MAGNHPVGQVSLLGPLAIVPLAAPAAGQRRLEIHRRNGGSRFLSLVDISITPGPPVHTLVDRNNIELNRVAILPLYTVDNNNGGQCEIRVVDCDGEKETTYSLRDRKAAFRFQRVMTGFRIVDYFDRVTCSIVYRYRGKLMGLGRAEVLEGRGELQLWRPNDEPFSVSTSVPPMTSDSVSNVSQLMAAQRANSGIDRRLSSITTRSEPPGSSTHPVIRSKPQKPVLLAFLRGRDHYTILRIDIVDTKSRRKSETQLTLEPKQAIESLSAPESELVKWDICAMMRRDKRADIKQLKCSNFSLSFADPSSMEKFEKRLVYLQLSWHKANNPIFETWGSSAAAAASRSLLPVFQQTSELEWDNWGNVQAWNRRRDAELDDDADTSTSELAAVASSSSVGGDRESSRIATPSPAGPTVLLPAPSTAFSEYTAAPTRRSFSQEGSVYQSPTGFDPLRPMPNARPDFVSQNGN